ncbi:MAG: hypothetical protein HW414_1815 [Dehalococcoidia bacterium]|nr:hypothetical protein [Dehalococcoidia bacterium]
MVTNNHSFEEAVRKLLAETQSELANIESQIAELAKKQQTLENEYQSYEGALKGYLRREGRADVERIKVSEVADYLYAKKFMKAKKRMNAYRVVYSLLLKMEEEKRVERVGPGRFRLLGTQQAMPGVSLKSFN